MWLTEVGTPVTSPDWDNGELGNDDGGADGSSDFLGGLDTETNVALRVTDDNDGLEAGALTGTGLLLDWLDLCGEEMSAIALSLLSMTHAVSVEEDPIKSFPQSVAQVGCWFSHLHNLILELWKEEVDNLVLLDWQAVEVDLLHALDLAGLDETTELGDWLPLLLLVLSTTTSWSPAATATATVSATVTTRAKSTTRWGACTVRHVDYRVVG